MSQILFKRWLKRAALGAPLSALALLAAPIVAAPPPNQPSPPTPPAAKEPAKPAAKDVRDAAKDTAKDARDTAKDARDTAKDARDAVKDRAKDVRDTAKDAGRDVRDSAKDTARDAKEGARDVRDSARDAVRDTTRDAKDTVRDSRDPAARDNPRDTARDARDTARDAKEGARDTARDARDNVRDARDTARTERREDRRSARDLGLTFGKLNDRGLILSGVSRDSVAFKAGLRDSDVILSINGHRLERADDFDRWVYSGDRRERVKIIVWRDGREEVVYFEPTVIWVEGSDVSYADDYRYFGVSLDDRYNDRIVVRKVFPDSPAYAAGLREGDVITTWHNERIATPADFGRVIRRVEPGTVSFGYTRDAKTVNADAKFAARAAREENRASREPAATPGTERRIERREDRREGAPVLPRR